MNLDITKAAFVLGTLGVILAHWRARRLFRREDAIVQKYKLYAIRDDLIHLIASHQLQEQDPVFTYFYEAMTLVIKKTEILNLRSLISALSALRAQGLDPAASGVLANLERELPKKDPQVRVVIAQFYQAVATILLENSVMLRMMASHPRLFTAALGIKRSLFSITQLFPFTVYAFYKEYKNAERRTLGNQTSLLAA